MKKPPMRTRAPSKPILTKEPIDAGNHPVTVFDDILPEGATADCDAFLKSHWPQLNLLSNIRRQASSNFDLNGDTLLYTLILTINTLEQYRGHGRKLGDDLAIPLINAAAALCNLTREFTSINRFTGCSARQLNFLTALWERLCEVASDVTPGDIADQVRRMRKSWRTGVIPLLSSGKNVETAAVNELAENIEAIALKFRAPLEPGIKLKTDKDVQTVGTVIATTSVTHTSPVNELRKSFLDPLAPTTHKPSIGEWGEGSTCADLDKSGRSRYTGKTIRLNHIENGASLKIENLPNGKVHYTFTSPSFTREYTITRAEAIAFIDLLVDAALKKTYSVWKPKWVKKNGKITPRRGDFQANVFKDAQGKKSPYANVAEFYQDLITSYDLRYEQRTTGKVRLGRPKTAAK